MGFDSIRDQDDAIGMIRRALNEGRLPHAYLFIGPSSVGRQKCALALAQVLNCEKGRDDACGSCRSCRWIDRGEHPDVKLLGPSQASRQISTQAMGRLLATVYEKPYAGRWKVYILLEADRMHPNAANRFLKTLEEPPPATLFILVAPHSGSVLPTIRSRCQPLRFRPLKSETVEAILKDQYDFEPEEASRFAQRAAGQVQRAVQLRDSGTLEFVADTLRALREGEDPFTLGETVVRRLESRQKEFERQDPGSKGASHSSPDIADGVSEEAKARVQAFYREETVEHLRMLLEWYRDAYMLASLESQSVLRYPDLQDSGVQGGTPGHSRRLLSGLRRIEDALVQIDRNLPPKRVFSNLFLQLRQLSFQS